MLKISLTSNLYFIQFLIVNSINLICLIHAQDSLCWPFNVVPFKITPGFTPYQQNYIKEQIGKINRQTCIYWSDMEELHSKRNLSNFVSFVRGNSGPCLTSIHYPYRASKLWVQISLPDHCFSGRYVLHEIIHALGFEHEHQRLDRDCYVWIKDSAKESSRFAIDPYFSIPSFDRFPYDKLSVMHYRRSSEMKALSERFYEWEPLGNEEERLTELDLWKIQYRFCGRAHYCEVHQEHCKQMEQWEAEMNCNFNMY